MSVRRGSERLGHGSRGLTWMGIVVATVVPGGSIGADTLAVQVAPGGPVSIQQIDFAFPDVPEEEQVDSDWGRLEVSVPELVESTGMLTGFLSM